MPWSNWIVEDIGIPVEGAPAVSSWAEGRLDVFVRSTQNRLYHRVYENNAWQGAGWADISGGQAIETSPAAVSWGPNRIDLFAVWGRQVHHRAYHNGAWSPWAENLDGITYDAPAAAAPKLLRVDVLVRTTDNRMSRRYWESGVPGNWQNWASIGGQIANLTSAPAAVASGPDRVACFGRSPTSRLVHTWYKGITQESWREIDVTPILDAPAAVSASTAHGGRVDVFVRGADDLLKHRIFFMDIQRGEPSPGQIHTVAPNEYLLSIARRYSLTLDQIKALNPQVSPPDFVVRPGDRLVIARQADAALYGDWAPWSSWTNLGPANKIASAPAAVGWWSGNLLKRIDCFARDANNRLMHMWWT